MNIQNKQNKVSINKELFKEMVTNSIQNINLNIQEIIELTKIHKDFINFVETMNILKIYEFNTINNNYNKLKQKINKDKKQYKKLSKYYGNIINYYLDSDIKKYNNLLDTIKTLNETMIFDFYELKYIHRDFLCNYTIFNKKINIIKINSIDNNITNILNKINTNYNNIISINKQIIILKLNKKKLKSQIKQKN